MYQGQKILLIDDDQSFLDLFTSVFESKSINSSFASGGREGLEKAKRELPELILLDIMMPDLDGIAVLGELKKYPGTKDIPVMIISNLPENVNKDKVLQMGAIDYIFKASNTPNQVIEKILKFFENS